MVVVVIALIQSVTHNRRDIKRSRDGNHGTEHLPPTTVAGVRFLVSMSYWVKFVVSSCLCSERCFSQPGAPVFPSSQKPILFLNTNSICIVFPVSKLCA